MPITAPTPTTQIDTLLRALLVDLAKAAGTTPKIAAQAMLHHRDQVHRLIAEHRALQAARAPSVRSTAQVVPDGETLDAVALMSQLIQDLGRTSVLDGAAIVETMRAVTPQLVAMIKAEVAMRATRAPGVRAAAELMTSTRNPATGKSYTLSEATEAIHATGTFARSKTSRAPSAEVVRAAAEKMTSTINAKTGEPFTLSEARSAITARRS